MARRTQEPTINALAVRHKLGLTQTEFWSRVGITQSGGSRYESGRSIPRPVQKLLAITYGTEAQREKTLAQLREHRKAV